MAPPRGAAMRWRETAAPRDGRRATRDSVRRELALAERLQLRQQVVRRQVAADLAAIGREDRRRAGNADLHAERELLGNGVLALLRRRVLARLRRRERFLAVVGAPHRHRL